MKKGMTFLFLKYTITQAPPISTQVSNRLTSFAIILGIIDIGLAATSFLTQFFSSAMVLGLVTKPLHYTKPQNQILQA